LDQYAYELFSLLYALLGRPLAAGGLVCSLLRCQSKTKTKHILYTQLFFIPRFHFQHYNNYFTRHSDANAYPSDPWGPL